MDISDFNIRKHIDKIDKIQTKEQLKDEAAKANIKEAAQISIAGDSADEVNNLMQIFRNAGVPVPEGYPAFSVDEAMNAYKKLGK